MRKNLAKIKWSTYIKTILILVCLSLLTVGFKSYQADPYWLWTKTPVWHEPFHGGNRILDNKQRFTKLLQVVLQQPDIILLGSSRVYRGIDTEAMNKIYAYKFYNMGISSMKITEIEAFVNHIVKWTPAKKIIIGLDFGSFRGDIISRPGFNPNTGSLAVIIESLFSTFFSKMAYEDALFVSKDTGQWKDGYWTFSGYKKTIDRDGKRIDRIAKGHEESYVGVTIPESHYEKLGNIVELGRKQKVEIEFFLTPMTIKQLQIIQTAGVLQVLEEWREKVKRQFDSLDVVYFDLITNHPFLTADLAKGSNQEWIDYHHYKPIVGSWILSKFSIDYVDTL